MRQISETVKHLIIINIIFFAGTALLGDKIQQLLSLYYFENPNFKFWQPLSHMFMHGGLMHIAFNMFALYSFGSTLESFWGPKKFLFFYISCGIGAALIHSGVNYYYFHDSLNVLLENGFSKAEIYQVLNEGKYTLSWLDFISQSKLDSFTTSYAVPAVGASGAIYGLLTAFAFMFPEAELMMMFIPVPIKAKYFVPFIIAMDLFSGVTGYSIFGGGIAHFAHVGGALFGFIMMWYWKKNSFNKNRWN